MVLADADEVDAELIGEDGLLDDVAENGGLRQPLSAVVHGDIAEGVEAQFNGACCAEALRRRVWHGHSG